jgi:hypothetical protein
VTAAINCIRDKAFKKIKNHMLKKRYQIKSTIKECKCFRIKKAKKKSLWHKGIAYAFWTHQYANACYFIESQEAEA